MDDDYSTDLLLASLLNDNIDDDDTVHSSSSPQATTNHDQLLKTPSGGGSAQQNTIANPTSDHFDSLEDLLNATLSPSEESCSDLDKTTSSDNASLVNIPGSLGNATPPEVVSKASTTSVGLPPKFRNTFRPVELCDTATKQEFCETTIKSPSYVVASQASTSSTNSNNVLTDSRLTTSSENAWQQLKNKTWNDSVFPPSKRFCSDHVSSYSKSLPSVTAVAPSGINPTTSLSGNSVYSNLLARTESNTMTRQQQQVNSHPPVSTSVSLNGVNSSANSNTTTATTAATIDLKRLQETNLVSELQAASTKPISSASIVHAIQVVQLNYGMLLQKLSQNLDDATAQEVKTKLMVLTHHYKQLVQQYQAKLTAEKTAQLSSSNVPTTTGRLVTTNTTASKGSVTNYSSNNQSSISNMMSSTTTPSTVIDLTHDKSIKTTPTPATNKESCVTVTAPIVQNLTNTTVPATAAGANVSSYLQSIPSLAAYLLQNTEAQKQLTPMELQQLNQIRVNLLQEFQRRQVQNFLTSLPADARPKNVNELKDMMKEKNFSIQVSIYLNKLNCIVCMYCRYHHSW